MEWKKLISAFLILAMVSVLGACAGTDNGNKKESGASAGSDDPLQKVRIGYLNVMDDAQAILAWRAGLYEKHGLDAEMVLFTSGTDLIKQMVGGNVDVGVLGFTNALSWIDKGSDLKVVGGAQMGYHALLVRSDSSYETVADLKGKSIASQKQGSTADVVLNGVVLAEAGLSRTDVTIQGVSPAVAIQSLASGTVDSAFVFEPYSSLAKVSYGAKEIYEIGQEWPFPCMVVIANGDLVNNHRGIVNKVLDAQKEAIEMLENDPAKAAEFIVDDFIQEEEVDTVDGGKIPAVDVIKAAIESQEFRWDITEEDIARMDEIAQFMVDQGLVENKVDVHQALDLTWQEQLK
jgi:NitT/TauT family transport system substrate-binding protein